MYWSPTRWYEHWKDKEFLAQERLKKERSTDEWNQVGVFIENWCESMKTIMTKVCMYNPSSNSSNNENTISIKTLLVLSIKFQRIEIMMTKDSLLNPDYYNENAKNLKTCVIVSTKDQQNVVKCPETQGLPHSSCFAHESISYVNTWMDKTNEGELEDIKSRNTHDPWLKKNCNKENSLAVCVRKI